MYGKSKKKKKISCKAPILLSHFSTELVFSSVLVFQLLLKYIQICLLYSLRCILVFYKHLKTAFQRDVCGPFEDLLLFSKAL